MFKEIKSLLLPTKSELFFYAALAFFLLIAQNISKYWSYFSGVKFEDLKNASSLSGQLESWILGLEAQTDPRIADFIIWMLLGMIAISAVLFVQSNLRNANDERDLLEHMRNPNGRVHELELYSLKIAVQVAGFIGLLIYARIFFGFINEALTSLFFVSSLSLNDPQSWLWLALSVLMTMLSLYMFTLLARVAFLRTRIFN